MFTFLRLNVDENDPDHVLSTEEVREWVTSSGGDPKSVPDGMTWVYRQVYEYMTIETLREIARRGEITDADVEEVTNLVARMPGVVIELLARAYAGNLMQPDDPDARAIHEVGQRLAGRFADVLLREAVVP